MGTAGCRPSPAPRLHLGQPHLLRQRAAFQGARAAAELEGALQGAELLRRARARCGDPAPPRSSLGEGGRVPSPFGYTCCSQGTGSSRWEDAAVLTGPRPLPESSFFCLQEDLPLQSARGAGERGGRQRGLVEPILRKGARDREIGLRHKPACHHRLAVCQVCFLISKLGDRGSTPHSKSSGRPRW